jgi:Predicted metal-dependent hydrolase with the TIM-barrel fold
MKWTSFITMLFFFTACQQHNADLIVFNGKIYTVNQSFDTASVLVIKHGRVEAVGGDTLLKKYSAFNTINLDRKYVYPGFIDAHCHFTGYAMDQYKLALFGTKSFDEVLQKVKAYAPSIQREWIEGRGWDQNDWETKCYPNKKELDSLFPDRPVFLMRIDGHAALCNQKALDKAGISINTHIEGGKIVIENNQLTGIVIDKAMERVKEVIPMRTQQEVTQDFINTQEECFSYGLTSVVDCGVKDNIIQWLHQAQLARKVHIRAAVMLSDEASNYEKYLNQTPYISDKLRIIGFKVYADGALGSRGAKLIEPYHDHPHTDGLQLISMDSLLAKAIRIFPTPYQLCVHAIGDGANRQVLQVFAKVLGGKNDKRWRIEHAQVVHPDDFDLFGQYNIIPSVQPTHATSDMYWATDRLGEHRMKTAYAYKQLLQQNNWLPLGTDFPVENMNPLKTFYAAVFRKDANGYPSDGFQPENALTRQEALRGITIWAAKSYFDEVQVGSLEKGKKADFVISATDLMTADESKILSSFIETTYIAGQRVYKRQEKRAID